MIKAGSTSSSHTSTLSGKSLMLETPFRQRTDPVDSGNDISGSSRVKKRLVVCCDGKRACRTGHRLNDNALTAWQGAFLNSLLDLVR